MKYDVIIIGAGPGGIFAAYELMKKKPECKIAVFEEGYTLKKRKCPIDGDKIKNCINCKHCSIMCGFGGAGAFSDGKYNITNDFGGTLYEYIGKQKAVDLMKYVDEINMENGGDGTKLYSTAGTKFKKLCLQNKLKLLDASVRHLGTDINYVVLQNLYDQMKDHMDFYFDTPVDTVQVTPIQICIVPVMQKKEGVLDKAYELRDRLAKNFRVKVDDSDKTPGFKFAEAEMRGYPIRVEIGPKDIEAGKCVICRRDTREKTEVALEDLETKAAEILETMQKEMLERARAHRDSHTYVAHNMEEFEQIFNEKSGFVKAMWCGCQECEDKIKEKLAVTSRCMPFEQEQIADTCVCCGKPAKKMVYWGRAY